MDKYNPKELSVAIKAALKKGIKREGMYTYLMFIPENKQNYDGYVSAKRFGYNHNTKEFDYLGVTDVMPWYIDYKGYHMDFIPGGINLFRCDRKEFKVNSILYSDTVIE